MKELLYTVAVDNNNNLIKAIDAEKGNDFFCPVCKSNVILRKSGNTGKGSKRPHFAHQTLTPNCTPETALHYSFKNLIADILLQDIANNKLPFVTWDCQFCFQKHTTELFKNFKKIKVEYDLGICKPDIAVFDVDDKLIAVIEIVVTHKPEENVLKFYEDNDIIVIQYILKSDKEIDEIEAKKTLPDVVNFCINPKCDTCFNFQQKAIMNIIDGFCWKCEEPMKVAVIGGFTDADMEYKSPDEFTEEEIEFARSKDVIIEEHFSKTSNDSYLANTCPSCKTFAGNFYLFTQYIQPASMDDLVYNSFEIGYYCNHCSSDDVEEMEDEEF